MNTKFLSSSVMQLYHLKHSLYGISTCSFEIETNRLTFQLWITGLVDNCGSESFCKTRTFFWYQYNSIDES